MYFNVFYLLLFRFYQVHQIVFDFLQSLFRAREFEEELLVVISDD